MGSKDERVLVGFRVAPEVERRIRIAAAESGLSKSEFLAGIIRRHIEQDALRGDGETPQPERENGSAS